LEHEVLGEQHSVDKRKKIDEIHFSGFAGPSASSELVKHAAVD
jgi:hypothetical protein